MLPSLISNYAAFTAALLSFSSLTLLVHILVGGLSIILSLVLVVRMMAFPPDDVGVYRRLMQTNLVLWIAAAGLGLGVYAFFYRIF